MSTPDTPRTNAQIIRSNLDEVMCDCVSADFARQLERDLTRLTAANKALVEALEVAIERVQFYKDCVSGETLEGKVSQAVIDRGNTALAAKTTQDKGTM